MTGSLPFYDSRTVAQASSVQPTTLAISVASPAGTVLSYYRDPSGTALTTADGATWSPSGDIYPDHFAENTTPGVTNMRGAIQAAVDYAAGLAGPGKGAAQIPAAKVEFASADYLCDGTVKFDGDYDSIWLVGNGARLIVPGTGPAFQIGADILFSGGDTKDTKRSYWNKIVGFIFVSSTRSSTESVAIRAGNCPYMKILENWFRDFYIAIDGHRLNTTRIANNTFQIASNRQAAALCAMQVQGVDDSVSPYTPGGGIHFYENEILGTNEDRTMLDYGLLIKAVDGFYFSGNHFISYGKAAISIQPDVGARNNVITDIISGGANYFDGPAEDARNVELTGSIGYAGTFGQDNGVYQNIRFQGDFFRGDRKANFGIVVSVTDSGGFVSGREGIRGFRISDCQFDSHRNSAINISGSSNGKVDIVGGQIHDSQFNKGNTESSDVSSIRANARSLSVQSNTVGSEEDPPLRAFSFNIIGGPNDSLVLKNNDCSSSTYSSELYALTASDQAHAEISGNVGNSSGIIHINERVSATTTDYRAALAWRYIIPGVNTIASLRARAVGHATAGSTIANAYARYDVESVVTRGSGAIATLRDKVVLKSLTSYTNNQYPVTVALLTGPSWSSGISLTIGDVVVNSLGATYLVITSDGQAGSVEPVHTTGALIIDGVRYMYLGAESRNEVAVIVSAENGIDMTWSIEIDALFAQA